MPRSWSAERPALLIAAVSGRRAGLVPLVADFFGDRDTQQAAHACRKLDGDIARGFQWTSLARALRALAASSPAPILGLVYGSGFEDRPKLLTRISARWTLLGNDAAVVERLKDPDIFFAELDRLGVAHPATSRKRPAKGAWLMKREGGAGGSHIASGSRAPNSGEFYYQERLEGRPISVLFAGNGSEARVLGFSEQWTVPSKRSPWRYGGAARPTRLPAAAKAAMVVAVERTTEAFGVVGLASADFMVEGGSALLLEINPRPGATLDIFDSPRAPLVALHLDAVLKRKLPKARLTLAGAMASSIVFAPRAVTVPLTMTWPDWAADRPNRGELIDKNRPICTVWARAATRVAAKRLITARTIKVLANLEVGSRGDDGEQIGQKDGRERNAPNGMAERQRHGRAAGQGTRRRGAGAQG